MRDKIHLQFSIYITLILWGCCVAETFAAVNERLANSKYNRGIVLMNSNPSLALIELQLAAKLNPKDPKIFVAIGQTHFGQYRSKEAIKAFEKAIKINNGFVEAYLYLGRTYVSLKEWSKAIQTFRVALKYPNFIAPHYIHNAIGWAYYEKNEFQRSIEELQKAIRLKENYSIAYYNLGLSLVGIENFDEAIKKYKMAIKYQPDLVQAHYQLALIFMKNNMEKEAQAEFQKVIELAPDSKLAEDAKNYLNIIG